MIATIRVPISMRIRATQRKMDTTKITASIAALIFSARQIENFHFYARAAKLLTAASVYRNGMSRCVRRVLIVLENRMDIIKISNRDARNIFTVSSRKSFKC
jgi:hypothetical protein